MTTKLADLMTEFSREDRKDIASRVKAHLSAMETARNLDDIRRATQMTQGQVALAMGIGQNAVSQLESRGDMQLSTLHRYVKSVGFHLELTVVAPNGESVALKEFKPWEKVKSKGGSAKRSTATSASPAHKTAAAKPTPRAKAASASLSAK